VILGAIVNKTYEQFNLEIHLKPRVSIL